MNTQFLHGNLIEKTRSSEIKAEKGNETPI